MVKNQYYSSTTLNFLHYHTMMQTPIYETNNSKSKLQSPSSKSTSAQGSQEGPKVLEYGTRRKVGSVVYKKQKLNKWLHMGWVTPHAPNAELKERQTLPKIFPNESSSTTHIDENTCHQNWVKAMHIF